MSLSDDLQKLRDLQQSGALTHAEFEAAKARLLQPGAGGPGGPPPLPPAGIYAPPAAPLASPSVNQNAATRQWAMILHLSQFAGFLIPFAGMVVPIVIWQIKKKDLPGLDVHGCHAANWILTEIIFMIIFTILALVFIGIPLMIILGILGIIFPIIAAIKGANGEAWRYPMSITFFRPHFYTPQTEPAAETSAHPHGW